MAGKLLIVKETAARLSVSESTIYRLMKKGELRPIKIGGSLRFDELDLEAYIQQAKEAD